MVPVTRLPILDRAGTALIGLRSAAEPPHAAPAGPVVLALVVVTLAGRILMGYDRWRGQWELPGGKLDPGETAGQAAVRELREETGIDTPGLAFAAVAEFELRRPARRESAAVYRCALTAGPRLVVNEEIAGFHWWDPRSRCPRTMSPLDAEIGRSVAPGPG